MHAVSAQDGSPKEQATVNSSQQSTQKSDRSGLTMSLSQALWASLAFEDKEQIAELLQSGADANAVEEISLMTPLMVSERGEVAKLLLDAGADPNSKDKLGRTVSHHAVKMSEAATVVRLLGEAGADIDVPAAGIANMTPLLCAIEYYIEDHVRDETALVIRMLAHLGADLEAVDSAGRSALAIAAAFNQPALIQLLIDLGADPQRATADGRTPLDYAREAKAEQAIRILASNPSKSLKAN
ncbi:MAG: ankyrin repeat domain-containing protein [Hyphomicrobiales bacterium]|nr:ankyrin repeat domain-containing protein [Hyphomicrobiales bacterium]